MICTFYSYKGGVGRSMALANVADLLSRRGLRTAIIDFDLEAPGIERFFLNDTSAARRNAGLLDLLTAYKRAMSASALPEESGPDFRKLDSFLFAIYHQLPSEGRLDLLPAGQRGDDEQLSTYAHHLRTFDWQEFYFEWSGGMFFQWLRRELLKRYDIVLVDSRTGVTEMGGVCAYQLADSVVMFCAANSQNVQGTRDILRNFESPRVKALRAERPLDVIVVPARVQQNSPEIERFHKEFKSSFEAYTPQALAQAGRAMWDLMIPYDGGYAFEERLVTASADNHALPSAFERIADAIALVAPPDSKVQLVARRHGAEAAERVGGKLTVEPVYDPAKPFAGFDAFLSYSAVDRPAVEEIALKLRKRGLKVWLDVWNLSPGEPFVFAIERAMEQSRAVAIFVGPSGAGPGQQNELLYFVQSSAVSRERRIIPVLLPGAAADNIAPFLRSRVYVAFSEDLDDRQALDALEWGIRGVRPEPRPRVEELPSGMPYKGLAPFEEEDARLFFGRDAEIDHIEERLRHSGFVAVVGASGAGKASLVRAGVIPRLRNATRDLKVVVVRPGVDPFGNLAAALATMSNSAVEGLARLLRTDREVLFRFLQPPSLLVIDQLEEIWLVANESSREDFLNLVAIAATNRVTQADGVIVILRADFYGMVANNPDLAKLISSNQILVRPPSREALRLAIEIPAKLFGLAFEPGLIDVLIKDSESATSPLPLLQFVLLKLYENRRQGFLTHEAYASIGGMRGALSSAADTAFASLSTMQRAVARNVLLRLVTAEGERTVCDLDSFNSSERDLLDVFLRANLVTLSAEHGLGCVTLSHDAVAREWFRLREWIAERQENLRARDRISHAASIWHAHKRKSDALYRGILLAEADRAFQSDPGVFGPEELAFLSASRAHVATQRARIVLAAIVFLVAQYLLVLWVRLR